MTETIRRYQAMMSAVLTALADGQLSPLKPVCDDVAALYGFNEEPLKLTLLSGKQTHIHSRIKKRMLLIDGNELAALMIAHNVGVLGDKAHSRTICR